MHPVQLALSEWVGSFVFFTVILTNGTPLAVAAALLAVCFFSGGHFNPAVSIMKAVLSEIDVYTCLLMIFMQFVAVICAIAWVRMISK